MDLSEKIRTLRKKNGMTLEEVGRIVGVGKSTVRKWENGDIKNMRRDKIQKLAEALNVRPEYLMGWEEEEEEPAPATQPRKWRILSAGALNLSDDDLDKLYSIAHTLYPDDFPLEDMRGDRYDDTES